uniref:Uncharacterized protein n=1 Tax=Ditylenchus dipsaci TaxID=166011 RepID=A0A915ES60_9BILA
MAANCLMKTAQLVRQPADQNHRSQAVQKLHKACLNYPDWKKSHRPNWKPWLYPEIQPDYPKINLEECRPPNEGLDVQQPLVDETAVSEEIGKEDDSD